MNNKYYILILSVVFVQSCKNTDTAGVKNTSSNELENVNTNLPLPEFMTWVAAEKNDLAKLKEVSDINYRMSYLPKESMAYIELKKENYTTEQFAKTCELYANMSYFNFRMELNVGSGELLKYKLSSPQQYDARVKYMSFQMGKDIFLVQGKDTLLPGLFHYERIFEVAPYATAMLAFDNKKFKKDQDFTIVYNDRLFNKGFIKYNYKSNQLIDLPTIAGI